MFRPLLGPHLKKIWGILPFAIKLVLFSLGTEEISDSSTVNIEYVLNNTRPHTCLCGSFCIIVPCCCAQLTFVQRTDTGSQDFVFYDQSVSQGVPATEDCRWHTPSVDTGHFKAFFTVSMSRVSKLLCTSSYIVPLRKVRVLLHRFSWNSQTLSSILFRLLTPDCTNTGQ